MQFWLDSRCNRLNGRATINAVIHRVRASSNSVTPFHLISGKVDTKQPFRLVASRVASLPPGTYTDPGQTGLQLRVRKKQHDKYSRTWLLRFKFKGEESRILLGHFPETTLEAARGLARDYREKASQGIDPRTARPRRHQSALP